MSLRLRFTNGSAEGALDPAAFDAVFYVAASGGRCILCALAPPNVSDDARLVQRQAFAGLLWSKQFYHYEVDRWLKGIRQA